MITNRHGTAHNLVECNSGKEAVERIKEVYDASIAKVRETLACLDNSNIESCEELICEGANYPYVGIHVTPANLHIDARLSYGVAIDPGTYGTTVTNPALFGDYFHEQIDLLIKYHKVPVVVGNSDWPIPLPFVAEQLKLEIQKTKPQQLNVVFALPDLSRVNDAIANNTFRTPPGQPLPLALFSGERVDYSLHRLHYYTGTAPKHFQSFILLTNYQRYIKEFVQYAHEQIENGSEFSSFVGPGDHIIHNSKFSSEPESGREPEHLPQMPAYHLKRPDGQGITFINIGIGPTNAKNITDHLAVLRPHCWIMLGHCAGFRRSQELGDYVLAHAYVREDHVLDSDLSRMVPLPAIAEVQVALQEAVANITGQRGLELKTRMRTGTVFTTDNRNWEFRSQDLFERFNQTRAIALDMESSTVAANGFRFRVPYGTLLCVSDKPIHGEIKLRGMAQSFYQERVHQHLKIGIEAVRLLRESGVKNLHSRKLRGFDEPPFR